MKTAIKMLGLPFFGLLCSLLLYPLLHEGGHLLTTYLLGGQVWEFSLFPVPRLLCSTSQMDSTGQVLIGLSGTVFPYLLSMAVRVRGFWAWYAKLILMGISTLSALLSTAAIVCLARGWNWQGEDIVSVLALFPQGEKLFLLLYAALTVYGCYRICREHPLVKCVDYFS